MIPTEERSMSHNPADLQRQVEYLTAENERLHHEVEYLRSQRKEYLDEMFSPAEPHLLTEEELAAVLKDPNRVSLTQFLADMGVAVKDEANAP
jgi:uncharacterized membrane protein